jgi:GNAT superfamily N-acetyltransferase
MSILIEPAQPADAPIITDMVGELLHEIMAGIGEPVFRFDAQATRTRAEAWMREGQSMAWLARDQERRAILGFVALYEAYALYAGGVFGTISELYVRPRSRSQGIGAALVDEVKQVAQVKGWTRLEVTTPPLPLFERTVRFYEHQGFTISGGRKMNLRLS